MAVDGRCSHHIMLIKQLRIIFTVYLEIYNVTGLKFWISRIQVTKSMLLILNYFTNKQVLCPSVSEGFSERARHRASVKPSGALSTLEKLEGIPPLGDV